MASTGENSGICRSIQASAQTRRLTQCFPNGTHLPSPNQLLFLPPQDGGWPGSPLPQASQFFLVNISKLTLFSPHSQPWCCICLRSPSPPRSVSAGLPDSFLSRPTLDVRDLFLNSHSMVVFLTALVLQSFSSSPSPSRPGSEALQNLTSTSPSPFLPGYFSYQ